MSIISAENEAIASLISWARDNGVQTDDYKYPVLERMRLDRRRAGGCIVELIFEVGKLVRGARVGIFNETPFTGLTDQTQEVVGTYDFIMLRRRPSTRSDEESSFARRVTEDKGISICHAVALELLSPTAIPFSLEPTGQSRVYVPTSEIAPRPPVAV